MFRTSWRLTERIVLFHRFASIDSSWSRPSVWTDWSARRIPRTARALGRCRNTSDGSLAREGNHGLVHGFHPSTFGLPSRAVWPAYECTRTKDTTDVTTRSSVGSNALRSPRVLTWRIRLLDWSCHHWSLRSSDRSPVLLEQVLWAREASIWSQRMPVDLRWPRRRVWVNARRCSKVFDERSRRCSSLLGPMPLCFDPNGADPFREVCREALSAFFPVWEFVSVWSPFISAESGSLSMRMATSKDNHRYETKLKIKMHFTQCLFRVSQNDHCSVAHYSHNSITLHSALPDRCQWWSIVPAQLGGDTV